VIHGLEDDGRFGGALVVRDFSGDGIDDLAIGAPESSRAGPGSGAIFVFQGGPTFAAASAGSADTILDAEGAGDHLGSALACGDVDGDARPDLLAGAPALGGAGRAYLFRGGATLGDRTAAAADAVLHAEAASRGEFGTTVAMVDVDGNGRDDMVVTAPGLDSGGADLGRVYVFAAGPALDSTERADEPDGRLTGSNAGEQLGRAISSDL
jgi:hypothetical protein